jgi:hypothetical protein
MMRSFLLVLLAAFVCVASGQEMLVRVYAPSWDALRAISPKHSFDVAGAKAGEYYDVVVDQVALERIRGSGIAYEVLIHSLEYQKDQVREQYLSYAQIADSLRDLAVLYPTICKFDSLPITTYQGNWQYYVKISDNPHVEEDDEPGFLIEGTHHSREWACPVTVMFFIDTMLSAYGSVSQITNLVNDNEFYCIPVINVDGYLYDYPSGYWWRKNREPFGGSIGTDPNRNYAGCSPDIAGDWGAVDQGGASHDPSDILFCGAYANSGDETRSLTLFVRDIQCHAYMSYHSYGEMLMWPWGWSTSNCPYTSLYNVWGANAANLIHCLGSGTYDYGPISTTIYPVSGSSVDWFFSWSMYVGGVPNLSFTVELGTEFYQNQSYLDEIVRENFDALFYLSTKLDSMMTLAIPAVAPPTIASLGTVGENFTVSWQPLHDEQNHPQYWELVELADPSVIEDNLESGTGRWSLNGFTLTTSQAHSGTHSFFSGNASDQNNAVQTIHPYLVEAGDSVSFWCRYNLETDYDVVVAEVSLDSKYWFNLDTMRFNGNQSSWVRKAFSLDDYVGRSVYVRFRYMSDGSVNSGGFYVDDIYPTTLFNSVTTIGSAITDTFYTFTGHAQGEYYYYTRGHNAAFNWGEYSCLEKADVTVGLAEHTPVHPENQEVSLACTPNPFRGSTTIRYYIPEQVDYADITIYNVTGQRIRTIPISDNASYQHISWQGIDMNGSRVPAGVYFVHLNVHARSGGYVCKRIEKITLLQ